MKKHKFLLISTILFFITIIFGSAYAYFSAQISGETNAKMDVLTGTVDSLYFEVDPSLNINANVQNFSEGKGNVSGSTHAKAILKANNKTNVAQGKYNVFFIIDENDFVYTTEEKTAEVVLKVKNPNNEEVLNITGLKRDENGFDITTRLGSFLIASDYEINTTSTTIDTWTVEVTLINLNSDQKENMGKTLNGRLYITTSQINTYELAQINTVKSVTTYDSITTNLDYLHGTSKIKKYYYALEEVSSPIAHKDPKLKKLSSSKSLQYIESDKPTHTFTNLKDNTTYKMSSYAIDEFDISSNIYETTITTDTYIFPTIENVSAKSTLYSITLDVRTTKGSEEITHYLYSNDDGKTYTKTTTPTYTFTNLLDTNTYKIKVKVVDKNNKESNVYYLSVDTLTYILPQITHVDTKTTYHSASLTIHANAGTNEVSRYFFRKQNDVNWTESATNSFTFNNLEEQKTYNFEAKVIDINNRESNIYPISNITTNAYVLPIITASATEITDSSFKIITSSTNGDGVVSNYRYSKDDGLTWTNWTTEKTYTFTNLTADTTHYIKVEAKDTNNRLATYQFTTKTDKKKVNLAFVSSNNLNDYKNYCITQINTSGTWENITNVPSTLTMPVGTKIKVNSDLCAINICTNSSCSSSNQNLSVYPVNKVGNIEKIYTITGNETHYSLIAVVCLTEDMETYILEKKKRKKKKIKDLKEGDLIYCLDEKTGKYTYKKIKKIYKSRVNYIFKVTLMNNEVIKCSGRHMFVTKELGTTLVDELKKGYNLLTANNEYIKVKDIEILNFKDGIDVYNLSFEDKDLKIGIFCLGSAMVLNLGIIIGSENLITKDSTDEKKSIIRIASS